MPASQSDAPLAAPLRALALAAATFLERLSPPRQRLVTQAPSGPLTGRKDPDAPPATPGRRRAAFKATPAPHHRVCHPLPLPPTSRLTVVLDFDETLAAVYPEPCPSIPVGRSRAAPTLRVSGVDLGEGACGTVRVFVRPGLVEFLEEVSTIADVVLFTAGLPGYAAPLVSALDPAGDRLPVRLYRASTRVVAGTPCVKDLSVLGRDLARVVLVDNSPFSFLAQPECGVPATPFDGCGDDAHLLTTVLPLLRELAEVEDVRPALAARFGMATWLASQAARGGWALYEPPESAEVAAGEVAAVAA